MLAALDSKTRVIGITSPDRGAGVSSLCRMVAESFAQSGAKTLLVDLSQQTDTAINARPAWMPGGGATDFIQRDPRGYEIIASPPTTATRPLFNNVETLRRAFVDELSMYRTVVVDLPAIMEDVSGQINPVAVSRACDAVILVCVAGRTRRDRIAATVSTLAMAGVQLGGTVLNDMDQAAPWQ